MNMFRNLSPEEVVDFHKWAQDNYTPGDPISPVWHPTVVAECVRMNEQSIADEEPETPMHYHVVAFIDGCLNDYDSGPHEHIEPAREECAELAAEYYGEDTFVTDTGNSRYEVRRHEDSPGGYIVKVEECQQDECWNPITGEFIHHD